MNKISKTKWILSKRGTYKENKPITIEQVMDKYTDTLYNIAYELAQFWKEWCLYLPFWEIKFIFTYNPTDED